MLSGTRSEAAALGSEQGERNSAAIGLIAGWGRMMVSQLRTLAPVPLGMVNNDLRYRGSSDRIVWAASRRRSKA